MVRDERIIPRVVVREKPLTKARGEAVRLAFDFFSAVLELWNEVAPDLIRADASATDDIGHKPDQIGKNRGHWNNMHQTVELIILRNELKKRGNGRK